MNLFIIFSIVFAVIIFAIVLQRIIHCPILVGFAIFAALLIVAAVFNNTTFVIIAIALGILAFIVAFLDCIFRNSNFLRNNRCLTCEYDNNNNHNNDDSDDTLTIVNSNGTVLARINGNTIQCRDNDNSNCCSCGCNNDNNIALSNGNILSTNDINSNFSNCGCSGRNFRYNR